MAIIASDIVKRLSVTAAAGDTTSSTPAASLGDQVSTTAITDASLANLMPAVTSAEALAGNTDYGCFFVLNNHATLTYTSVTVAILSQTAGGSTVTIALDNIAVSAKGSASAQAAQIGSKQSAPSGVGTFGAGPLSIGDLAPGQVKAVWVQRVTTAGTVALNPDGVIIRFSGGTDA